MLSKPILNFIHPADVEKTANIIKEQMGKGVDVIQFENRYKTKKGDFRWFEWSANPVPAEGITYSAAYDITDQKQSEKKLRESEEKFRIISDFTNDSEYWIGPEGELIYQSPSIEDITGYKAEEFYKNHPDLFFKIIHPDDSEKFQKEFPQKEKNKTTSVFRIITKAGKVRWIENISQSVYSSDGEYLGMRGSSRDITERKQVEEALKESEEQ